MRRRRFLAAASAVAILPPLARAQKAGRIYRIGLLVLEGSSPASRDPAFMAFLDELAKAGFVEGKNLTIERLGIATRPEQFPELAKKVVALGVDAIYATGAPAAAAAKRATQTLPLAAIVDDMVESGIVPSLSQPGGNLTGISILATELDGKRQEILFELLPEIHRMAALADPKVGPPAHAQELRQVAYKRGVELLVYPVAGTDDIAAALATARAAGAGAVNVLASPLLYSNRELIFERCLAAKLPAMYQWPEAAGQGGLIAYGPSFAGVYRQFGRQVVKLLRGAKPADIPVEQPAKFELAVNLKTAKAIGVTVPKSLLVQAADVID
ncbi:MAG TPA: ABC transporter substrate-binding protein [Stellaceae bacterium]|nr:ABC transporter substrate-binding protein [Stellaceae bacterium]